MKIQILFALMVSFLLGSSLSFGNFLANYRVYDPDTDAFTTSDEETYFTTLKLYKKGERTLVVDVNGNKETLRLKRKVREIKISNQKTTVSMLALPESSLDLFLSPCAATQSLGIIKDSNGQKIILSLQSPEYILRWHVPYKSLTNTQIKMRGLLSKILRTSVI
ncbi:hypothetical protein [Candidatus Bealeia paramacronuclearis]